MRTEFVARGVVCLAAMPPNGLDLVAFETATGLDRPVYQVINPQLAVVEYARLRLTILLGQPANQVQIESLNNPNRDLWRRATAELIRQATPFAIRGLGFNGFARIEIDDNESPVADLLNTEVINERLNAEFTRAGVKLVYPLDGARATLDISPAPDDEHAWVAAINRHYAVLPEAEVLERAISWSAALDHELRVTVRRLISGPGSSEEEAIRDVA
jgi:hypothetical protein